MQLKSVHESPADDLDKHDGRVRSFEHERGNWATYVYIPIDIFIIEDLQEAVVQILQDFELKSSLNLHISLTKTLVLQHHWIDSFITSIRSELHCLSEFTILFCGLKIYCNEERTRTFIGLSVNEGNTLLLQKTSKRLDSILREYRLPEFYENGSYHASILWCLGDHEQRLQENIMSLEKVVDEYLNKHPKDFEIKVNRMLCKTGNKLFQFPLS